MSTGKQSKYLEEIRNYCEKSDNGKELHVGSIVVCRSDHTIEKITTGEKTSDYYITIGKVTSIIKGLIGIEITAKYYINPEDGEPISKSTMTEPIREYPLSSCETPTEKDLRSNSIFNRLANRIY
ncbi:MAG: hypothetical protein KAW14_14575 [Candidatus Aegiribacteria sp.]|nr:hypothetical protein [Candidatus Aegiribacteria sp.]